jgi:hypothetical protein
MADENAVNETATTTTETSAPSTESTASVETAAPVATTPSVESVDYKAQFEALQSEMGQYKQYLGQLSQQNQEFQKRFTQAFMPQEYERQNQPKYVTADDLQKQFRAMQQHQEASILASQFRGELSSVKEKFSDLFTEFPGAEEYIKNQWANSNKSVTEIAKDLKTTLDKAYEARQSKYISQKQTLEKETKSIPRAAGASSNGAKTKGGGMQSFLNRIRAGSGD